MTKEAYCSDDVCKLLKEKGFKEPCTGLNKLLCKEGEKPLLLITHQKAMAWLREAHHIAINIGWGEVFEEQYRWWSIVLNMDNGDILYDENYQASYEESVETTLKYCLENLI